MSEKLNTETEKSGSRGEPSARPASLLSQPSRSDAPVITHTPGPWFAREQLSVRGESSGWIVEHGNGRIGWSSYATAQPNEGERAPYPIGAANARLIAAAPDYHAAACALVTLHDNAAKLANFAQCGCADCKPFRSIITKAEGSQP